LPGAVSGPRRNYCATATESSPPASAYTGGQNGNPTADYHPGHAEAVEVTFDPERTSYRQLLEFFFQIHRPDLGEGLVGSDYRSEISIRATSSAMSPRTRSPTPMLQASLARQGRDEDQRGCCGFRVYHEADAPDGGPRVWFMRWDP
jgi:hypothetical protein